MISEKAGRRGGRYDHITAFTIRIWSDMPEQTVKTLIRRRRTIRLIRVYTGRHSPNNFTFTCKETDQLYSTRPVTIPVLHDL